MALLKDIVRNKGYTDAAVGIIDEVSRLVPEINFFDARLIDGTQFKSLYRDGLPSTGFRTVGNGIDSSRSSFGLRTFDLGILAGLCQIDRAEAQAACYPGIDTIESFLADQATDLVVSAMKQLASKIWYGDKSSAESFDGVSALATLKVDAGGTTEDGCSSVYAVGNSAAKACGLVFAKNSGFFLSEDLEWKKGTMAGANSKPVPCYWADLTGWAGFSAVDSHKMARLCNLDASKPLSDSLLYDLIYRYEKENDGLRPDALFVSYGQRRLLQKARSAIYPAIRGTKGELTAPTPVDFEGIPLIATNAVLDTEAVVS